MKKNIFLFLLAFTLKTVTAQADSVILMIGDGMGMNHIKCVAKDNDLFLEKLNPVTEVKTASADNTITDSAAAGTAYACGIKTNNGYIGMNKHKKPCKTLAELAVSHGKKAYLISSDIITGATPSAFYAHTPSRHNTTNILSHYMKAKNKFYTDFNVSSVAEATSKLLNELSEQKGDYFVMIEGAKIDKASHHKDYKKMEQELIDFDKAVAAVFEFATPKDNVHVFVTADHETGRLDDACHYHLDNHSAANVWLYAKTKTKLPTKPIENTDVNKLIRKIMNLPAI